MKRWIGPLVPPLIAVFAALLVGAGFILTVGQDPIAVYGAMASGVFGSAYGWGQVLFKATPLVFSGLAVVLGFRAGLFNIGAEGQAMMGSFVMGVTGAWLAPRLPGIAVMGVASAAGIATGAAYAAIPGVLKARFGAHEVINTIMLNFVAAALINYFGHAAFVHETVHTPELPPAAMLTRLGAWWPPLQGSPVNLSLGLAALACVVVGLLLWRTPFGYELRATGMNPGAAEYGGTRVPAVWVKTMALSGALSALVGVNFVLGYKGYFESGFTSGVGFLGIAVALLGRTHPIGIVLAAFFFGALSQGGLVINSLVPKELVDILQAIVILMAIVSHETVERWMRKRS
ncbi:MAG TPA: ABC transporter permease [Candidatus Eisenbacteria bacterium]|nr:ABC transporter permease [Candidatus Eisenbacteria bacterium]